MVENKLDIYFSMWIEILQLGGSVCVLFFKADRRSNYWDRFFFFFGDCFTIKKHYQQNVKYWVEKFGTRHPGEEMVPGKSGGSSCTGIVAKVEKTARADEGGLVTGMWLSQVAGQV